MKRAGARDRGLVYASAFLRATAIGMAGVQLGLYLATLGFSSDLVGYIVAAGLAGGAAAALMTTAFADAHGRRRFLFGIAVLGAAGSAVAAASSHPFVLGAAVFFGMLNGMGRDRGAALILEQAILPSVIAAEERTRALAWYNVLQDIGHAMGALFAGMVPLFGATMGAAPVVAHRGVLVLYAVLLLATALLYPMLSPRVEGALGTPIRVSAGSRKLLARISALFALDSLGGGFLTTALLSYFFFERFGASPGAIGALFFAARVLNALSHFAAAWLAKRIGLVNTMVFTHIPSSLLLVTVAFSTDFQVAAVLFLLREGLVEMDVPTRQSYVLAVVRPEERTVASGVTHLVRMAAWAVAPSFAGLLMGSVSLMMPLVVGAAMKITYDGLLYFSFRAIKPPEEAAKPSATA